MPGEVCALGRPLDRARDQKLALGDRSGKLLACRANDGVLVRAGEEILLAAVVAYPEAKDEKRIYVDPLMLECPLTRGLFHSNRTAQRALREQAPC
jgi:hypothetical protein